MTAGGPYGGAGDPLLGTGGDVSTGATSVGHETYETHASRDTRSLGEIVGEVTNDLSLLMKQELELAKVELKDEAKKAGKGAGMLAGAGIGGHMLLVFLSLALMFLLDNVMPIELAALIVAVLWGIVAAVLASIGRKNLKQATPPLPTTQQTLKEDAQWAKHPTS